MYRLIHMSSGGNKYILGCVGKIVVAMVGYNLEIKFLFDERDNSIDQYVSLGIVQSIGLHENQVFVVTNDSDYILESVE